MCWMVSGGGRGRGLQAGGVRASQGTFSSFFFSVSSGLKTPLQF